MQLLLRSLVFGAILVCLQDVAHAQLLGRRWERRKAELRCEVSAQLASKVDRDLDREMGDVRQSNDQQLESLRLTLRQQGEDLRAEIEGQLSLLRSNAQELVKAEAERLDREVRQQIADLRQAAARKIADESRRLEQVVENELEKTKEQTAKDVASAWTALTERHETTVASTSRRLEDELAKLPGMVDARIQVAADRILPELKAAIQVAITESLPGSIPTEGPRDSRETPAPSAALLPNDDQQGESDEDDSEAE